MPILIKDKDRSAVGGQVGAHLLALPSLIQEKQSTEKLFVFREQ